jgi:hypothetical protein
VNTSNWWIHFLQAWLKFTVLLSWHIAFLMCISIMIFRLLLLRERSMIFSLESIVARLLENIAFILLIRLQIFAN